MPRDLALLHPTKPLAPLLAAATVLLLRDGPQGVEVLMTRRSMQASFAPGAYVFPGGGIEKDDQKFSLKARAALSNTAQSATDFIATRSTQTPLHISWALAAIRESFEELGIVLAKQSDGAWISQAQVQSLHRHANFYTQMAAKGFHIAANEVYLLARWLTDRDMPKRFDVPFLVARVPPDQTPVADESEQFAPEWIRPQDALERHQAKQFFMIFPTVRTLERLASYRKVADVLRDCASEQPLWTSCPRAGLMHGKEARLMEHESAYGELAMVAPFGQIAHELSWQHERAVPLLQHVMRLTAPNPGMMTGPGTNTYIVGTAHKGFIVIDPGPDVASHIERIMRVTDGDIVAIVCTHSHADHSPAALPLQARVVEASNTVPMALTSEFARHICPILGLASAPTARDHAWFSPDIELQHEERLDAYFRQPYDAPAFDISLQVLHTPGHAANHVCLVLPQDGLLFSGDHILNGSTTIIDPPDGDMSAYLDSLDALDRLCAQHDIRFILPAHGYVLSHCEATQVISEQGSEDARGDSRGGARRAIGALKTHRLKREAKVMAAMRLKPQGSIEDWVAIAYGELDAKLWPVAARSLAAHVKRIKDQKLG